MTHKFKVIVAKEVGILGAILYENIEWWCMKNKVSNINKYDGYYWTYNSNKGWAELFEYATESQIKLALKKLEDSELVVSGVYNKTPYDRTKWYRVNRFFEQTEKSNETERKDQPIPVNKPVNKPINKKEQVSDVLEEWINYRKQIKKSLSKASINKLIKDELNNPKEFKAKVEFSITNGYQGLFAPKQKKEKEINYYA